uniref:DSBA-like thioredoxin domain-containing protein n=1 Tax=Entomoneis paludosa TaxID=265537 RepID=A0A7S3DN16_9STRA|mmetsp:Transcript_22334/g.46556  ORF Transcript_22334/g.46556 Transcript_22334/m.46556 type:complete len:249 (+) Transcript_22334:220-966(+)|eukprot:CAMPEP_0172456920 /NCGR_PEP_ID=MMETSP1065-20121228/18591_1 /TAXON_ID=265537 /ORGANISM="Amphiprora paludosa, Strain CCMP125" /LENGTH=248 /DNA_ID=CAMNT_0013210255 /DNA_START=148 /DNA_END=894 /DNA_ORIENTATION=+
MNEVLAKPLPTAPRPIAFSVLRVPFMLEPEYDENRVYVESNRDRLVKKWGGKQGWERQKRNHDLKGRGLDAGIPHFNLDRLAANSMASHRLIQWIGKTYGLQVSETIYDLLNTYYFVDGHSLNDKPRLAQVVAAKLAELSASFVANSPAPATEAELFEFLNGNQGRAEIEQALVALNELGVHGIPKFVIEGQRVVDGAAHSSVFVRIFREIEARGQVQGPPVFADILGVSDDILQQGSHHVPQEDVAA